MDDDGLSQVEVYTAAIMQLREDVKGLIEVNERLIDSQVSIYRLIEKLSLNDTDIVETMGTMADGIVAIAKLVPPAEFR